MKSLHRVALVCLVALIAWGAEIGRPAGELRDYGSFIASGGAAAEGHNPYGIYPLTFHVVLPNFEVWNPNLNPPVSVPVFAAMARLDPHVGFVLWWVFSLGCYVGAVVLLVRRYGAGPGGLLLLWALALAGFWDTLALGQIYLPLVLLAVGSWLLLEGGRPVAAGLLMGCVVAVKPNFAVWPAMLLLAGHSRVALTCAASAVLISATPYLFYGGEIYQQWVTLILSDTGRAAFLTNASLPGFSQRIGLAPLGLALSLALLATLALWAFRMQPDVRRCSALALAAGVAASPIAWVHYTLFLLPAFFALPRTRPVIAAAVLLVVPVPVVLRALDAPLWQQATIGSVYNWAVILCLIGLWRYHEFSRAAARTRDDARVLRRRLRPV